LKAGLGLGLVRENVAISEARRNKLVIVNGLTMSSVLSFVALAERIREASIAAAFDASIAAWPEHRA
jgi:hypothetical protein